MTNNNPTINLDMKTQIKNVSLDNVKDTLKFSAALGDVIKWQLIGLYIKNDTIEIEKLESMFTKSGAFYDRRAYKTEAKTVFKLLDSDKGYVFEGKAYFINDIANMTLENRPFSIGMAYKNRPKTESKPSNPDLKAAKAAMEKHNLKDQGIPSANKLLELANSDTVFAEQAKSLINEAKLEQEQKAILSEFPEFTTENLPKIKTAILDYMQNLAELDKDDFDNLLLDIMAIHPDQDIQEKAA